MVLKFSSKQKALQYLSKTTNKNICITKNKQASLNKEKALHAVVFDIDELFDVIILKNNEIIGVIHQEYPNSSDKIWTLNLQNEKYNINGSLDYCILQLLTKHNDCQMIPQKIPGVEPPKIELDFIDSEMLEKTKNKSFQ